MLRGFNRTVNYYINNIFKITKCTRRTSINDFLQPMMLQFIDPITACSNPESRSGRTNLVQMKTLYHDRWSL